MTVPTMPPLTGILHRNADYYQMEWLPDGYPARRQGDDLWAHPLYGSYVLKDYLEQLERNPAADVREALRTVVAATLARMGTHENSLVFWYEGAREIARSGGRHYSGLTQGYYAVYLARAARVLGDPAVAEAADRVFASLTVPVQKGGVYSEGVAGPSIAEVSQEPNSHILNGWQSALAAVVEYARVTGQPAARELAVTSGREMARLLPLYDAPALRNSRYCLSGFVYARLVFRGADVDRLAVRSARLSVPGEGVLPIERIGGRRWENHVLTQDVVEDQVGVLRPVDKVMRLNLVLSRISYPVPNRLLAEIESEGITVEVQLQRGRYDPLTVSQADRSWVTVARFGCTPGTTRLDVPLPWDVADLVAYPTNFAKVMDGHQTNVYHTVHVDRLRELASSTGIGELREWADTWSRYIGDWGAMPLYDGLHVRVGKGSLPVGEAGRALPISVPGS